MVVGGRTAAGPRRGPQPACASGKRVLVLEARDRVGGRLLNHTLQGGSVIESGGAFVGPTQNHILALAKELKVENLQGVRDG